MVKIIPIFVEIALFHDDYLQTTARQHHIYQLNFPNFSRNITTQDKSATSFTSHDRRQFGAFSAQATQKSFLTKSL
ncbi:hypothetical protein HMPREF0574_1281 [Mobiluncus curtisii subsp. curtisii ATCC 35241]|uniref:Uncharacterized protein n=2 Tax=Mobiluncus curtisii TaxID=2051 RepID=D6ZJP4_MOBCV|nr:hypothetical protein HMPREF0573_10624 [Mobiluncus curtisii ATCC 43063]EFL93551.1 hypothetical protein HMPREF0574_1281 [Mobiluncus curtisii subsp. curtisii ATCC 35241]MCU9987296.1 hypothetical protein [Mobiluncus curtisii]MCV0001147.1 hypothetical protein [Mobiluncus curtisii]MCV0020224.1 hypothetical protein [Mobiluncus curtisii]